MQKVHCSIEEKYVNPLFEVFDGGDFVLSSYRDVEAELSEVRIFFSEQDRVGEAKARLRAALEIVGVAAEIEAGEIPDEDWKFSYRRHFKTDLIGRRLAVVPAWEMDQWLARVASGGAPGRVAVTLDPGLAFGTGRHETTRACLEYIEELSGAGGSFLDMGCGSGILSIAAVKLGYGPVAGFDVDQEAVDAARENAAANETAVDYAKFALGRAHEAGTGYGGRTWDLVAANILGPLLIRFADEIAPSVGRRLIISGILNELYPDVLAAYAARGFREAGRRTLGEWTTGLLERGAEGIPENRPESDFRREEG